MEAAKGRESLIVSTPANPDFQPKNKAESAGIFKTVL
jgi:hypothetical protein